MPRVPPRDPRACRSRRYRRHTGCRPEGHCAQLSVQGGEASPSRTAIWALRGCPLQARLGGGSGPEDRRRHLGPLRKSRCGQRPGQRGLRTRRRPRPQNGRGLRLPWWAGAEDTRFELVKGCPQHAFQLFARGSGRVRQRPDLRREGRRQNPWTPPNGDVGNPNCNPPAGQSARAHRLITTGKTSGTPSPTTSPTGTTCPGGSRRPTPTSSSSSSTPPEQRPVRSAGTSEVPMLRL
ncbi:hypothetical protein ABIA32_000387 [Streptacidiphilus sp. MAP12-20]